MGFPVVNILKISKNTFEITQKHFLIDPRVNVTVPSKFG